MPKIVHELGARHLISAADQDSSTVTYIVRGDAYFLNNQWSSLFAHEKSTGSIEELELSHSRQMSFGICEMPRIHLLRNRKLSVHQLIFHSCYNLRAFASHPRAHVNLNIVQSGCCHSNILEQFGTGFIYFYQMTVHLSYRKKSVFSFKIRKISVKLAKVIIVQMP